MGPQPSITNEELSKILPNIKKEFDVLSSMSFQKYEERIENVTNSALNALQTIISDGTLEQDPEQLVRAVEVLTKAKTNLWKYLTWFRIMKSD